MPVELQDPPEVPTHLMQVWRGFWQVHNTRPKDGWGGVGSIALTEMESLMRLWRITDWEAQLDFIEMLQALDREYLTYLQEQQELKQNRKTASEVGH